MCGWVPGTEVPHVLDIVVLVSAWWPGFPHVLDLGVLWSGVHHFPDMGVWVGAWLQEVPHFPVGVWVGAWYGGPSCS